MSLQSYLLGIVHAEATQFRRHDALVKTALRLGDGGHVPEDERAAVLESFDASYDDPSASGRL